MAYAVVYGSDGIVRRAANATECLGLVKSLHGRDESNIRILDDLGVEIKLVELEKRHRNEVESKFLFQEKSEKHAPPPAGSTREGRQRPARTARVSRPNWGATTVLYLIVTFPIAIRVAIFWLRERFARKEPP